MKSILIPLMPVLARLLKKLRMLSQSLAGLLTSDQRTHTQMPTCLPAA